MIPKPPPTGVGKEIQDEILKLYKTVETSDFNKDTLKIAFSSSREVVLSKLKAFLRGGILEALKEGADEAKKKVPDIKRKEYEPNESEAKAKANRAYARAEQDITIAFTKTYKTIADEISKNKKLLTYQVKNKIIEKLKDEGFVRVEYANGAMVPVDAYAEMVANTTSIEAFNSGAIDYAINSADLVQMTEIFPTCSICAKYQGRVYSVSGEDKRYPSLYDTVLSKGYNTVHPNCRHQFIPYFEEFQTEDKLKEAREKSNKPFIDKRSNVNKETYKKWQELNGQQRERKNKKLEKK